MTLIVTNAGDIYLIILTSYTGAQSIFIKHIDNQ